MKKILIISCIMLLGLSLKAQWVQLGSDIYGSSTEDRFGRSLDLNQEGNIIAISSPLNDLNAAFPGVVRVYRFENNNWVQMGSDIDGTSNGELFGLSLSISDDGNTLAIGSPYSGEENKGTVRVFTFNTNEWIQMGSNIAGISNGEAFGYSMSLSGDASRVVIGSPFSNENGNNAGKIMVYEYDGGSWTKQGSDILGDNTEDLFGFSCSINSDGSIIASGAITNDNSHSDAGQVKVYEFQSNNWVQIGNDILGSNANDRFGVSLDLNNNGNIIAIGSTENDVNGSSSGQVKVYENINNNWVQLANNLNGEASTDRFGISVSLNDTGDFIAIGGDENDENASNSGHVKVFELSGNSWIQKGTDIFGDAENDFSGVSVSLNGEGSRVATGATLNDGNGTNSGQVRVFNYSNVGISEIDPSAAVYPNPTNRYLHIDSKEFIYASIYNLEGVNLLNFEINENKHTLDLVNFKAGIYILKLYTKKNKFQSKTIILK